MADSIPAVLSFQALQSGFELIVLKAIMFQFIKQHLLVLQFISEIMKISSSHHLQTTAPIRIYRLTSPIGINVSNQIQVKL